MPDHSITHVSIDDDLLTVQLDDGRILSTPLAWYPRLLTATPAQRANWEIVSAGLGVSWAELDEDLSLSGMLRGQQAVPAPHVAAAE